MRFLEWTGPARKYFEKLPANIQRQIRSKIERLREDPFTNTVELHDWEWEGIRRIRSGDWRILFRVTNDAVRIISIGPRGDVYK